MEEASKARQNLSVGLAASDSQSASQGNRNEVLPFPTLFIIICPIPIPLFLFSSSRPFFMHHIYSTPPASCAHQGKRGHNRSTCCIVSMPRRRCRIWIKGAGASVHWKAGRNMRNKESPLSSSFCSLTSHKFLLCCLC